MPNRTFSCSVLFILVTCFLLFSSTYSSGATLNVTNTSDSGAGSLRQAIADAASGDIIIFPLPQPSIITLTTGQLEINKNLSIQGPGMEDLVISGNYNDRVFNISNCTLSISDLAVKEGDPRENTYPDVIGGGFLITDSDVTLNRVLVSHNRDKGYMSMGGAGICHQGGGSLAIYECTVEYNQSGPDTFGAGGIYCEAPLHMENSTVMYNGGSPGGVKHGRDGADISSEITGCLFFNNIGGTAGGLEFQAGSGSSSPGTLVTVLIENCTVYSNMASGSTPGSYVNYGGGIQADYNSVLNIINTSIVNNVSDGHGGGLYAYRNSIVNLKNSILANNVAMYGLGDNWITQSGNIISQGYNIIGPADGQPVFSTGTDIYSYPFSMGSLSDNGGPTLTLPLPSGSPAIDRIPHVQGYPDTDQRGVSRPENLLADIGPFEYLSIPDKPVILSPLEGDSEISLEAPLSADAYSHPGSLEHASTLWQISTSETSFDEDLLWELSSDYFLTYATVAPNVLEENSDYFLRVRYTDVNGGESFWSEVNSFSTLEISSEDPLYDGNDNGIPDDQEVVVSLDLDGNEVDDNIQEGMKALESGNGYGEVSILAGDNVDSINSIRFLDPETDIHDERNMPEDFSMGILSFNLTVIEGTIATITVFFEETLPMDTVWYKLGDEGWYDYTDHAVFAPDMKSVELSFQDGGFGDADGLVNGTIVDPSGPVFSSETGSGNGGCNIGGNALSSLFTLIPLLFMAMRKK